MTKDELSIILVRLAMLGSRLLIVEEMIANIVAQRSAGRDDESAERNKIMRQEHTKYLSNSKKYGNLLKTIYGKTEEMV